MRRLAALGLVAVTSCAPVPVVRSIDAGWRSPRPAGPFPRSCAVSPGRQVVPATVRTAIAHIHIAELSGTSYGPPSPDPIRGTSWLLGATNHGRDPVLLHLSARGELQTVRVPFHPEEAVVSGDHIRLLKPWTTEGPAVWAAIDVSSPDAPKVGPVQQIPDLKPKEWPLAFAAGEKFALLVTRPIDPPGAPLTAARFNVSTGRREMEYVLGKEARIADAWCSDEGCAIIASVEGGGLISVSFFAEGGSAQRLLVEKGAYAPVVAPTATGGVLLWERPGERGIWGLSIDALGDVHGAVFPVAIDAEVRGMVVVRSDDGDAIALRVSPRAPASWLLAPVAPGGRSFGKVRELPILGELFLSAAGGAGGVVFVGTTSNVSYDDAGGYSFHSWSATVSAMFQAGGAAGAPVKLLSSMGEGRGGFHGLPVVRGAWAGAILVPSGEAYPGETTLVSLRAPCGG